MDAIDRDIILRLADRTDWPSVSLYLPADHLGIHTDADRIRLRNLLKVAHDRLVADGLRDPSATQLLSKASALSENDAAWAGGPSGLAIFATPDSTEVHWTSEPVPELAIVGDRFYLRPLFATRLEGTHAWALAIDSNKTRLFHVSRDGVEEVALPTGTPTSLAEITKYEVREESLQYHTMPEAGGPGRSQAMFHGHGSEHDFDKIARVQFMRQLSHGVVERIGNESSEPLVLLGVDYMIEEFRGISDYAHLAAEHVEGATDYLSPADVQKRTLAVLAPRAAAATAADIAEFAALSGTGRSATDPSQIVSAAAQGRVKMLLMDDSAGPYGYLDRATYEVARLCPVTPRLLRDSADTPPDVDIFECGWDLVDLAAIETLRHGGSVRAFRGEDSPVTGAAAILRY